MARTVKKTAKVNGANKVRVEGLDGSGPRLVEGFLHFSERDLLRYELAQHKVANSLQAISLKRTEAVKAEKERNEKMTAAEKEYAQKLALVQGDVGGLNAILKREEADLLRLQEEIGAAYEVDLSQVTYDTETGKLHVHGEPIRRDG